MSRIYGHPPACTCVNCDLRRRSERPRSVPPDIENLRPRSSPRPQQTNQGGSSAGPALVGLGIFAVLGIIGFLVFLGVRGGSASSTTIIELRNDTSAASVEVSEAKRAATKEPSPENARAVEAANDRYSVMFDRIEGKCAGHVEGAEEELAEMKREFDVLETELAILLLNTLGGDLAAYREAEDLTDQGKAMEAKIEDIEDVISWCRAHGAGT